MHINPNKITSVWNEVWNHCQADRDRLSRLWLLLILYKWLNVICSNGKFQICFFPCAKKRRAFWSKAHGLRAAARRPSQVGLIVWSTSCILALMVESTRQRSGKRHQVMKLCSHNSVTSHTQVSDLFEGLILRSHPIGVKIQMQSSITTS